MCYEDYKRNSNETNAEVSNIFNVVKRFRKAPRTWKDALITRNPKKNYTPEDLTAIRDISVHYYQRSTKFLPSVCAIADYRKWSGRSAVNFWQRAHIKNRDRQELIFFMQTAIDDFKHISSWFSLISETFLEAWTKSI